MKTRSNRRLRGSKQQYNDEMCQILAYVYLVEHYARHFPLFSDYQCRPPFYGNGHAYSLLGQDIRISGYAIAMHVIQRTVHED